MNQIPLITRLALNEFQASCYSHHRSQSALSETNWPLRVSGCSPYLESLPSYTDGAPPWTPTNRGHGITSRPLTGAMEFMPSTHNIPLYTCFSSYNSHWSQYQSSKNKQAPKQRTASPNPSLRLKGFAQARRARSGEPPFRLGEGSMEHSGNITGSRLGETPLAWARCSLAQKFEQVAWATFRAIALGELPVSSRLGEIDSLGRD